MAKLDPAAMAAQYGWAMAVLNSDASLKAVFSQAVAGNWTADRFAAAVKNTTWYKNHGEAWRKDYYLQKSDPSTWRQNYNTASAGVAAVAQQIGARIGSYYLDKITRQYMSLGWNDSQLKAALSPYITFFQGSLSGEAGQTEDELRAFAQANGVHISDGFIQSYARNIEGGKANLDQAKDALRQYAINAFPVWADQLKAGVNLSDIASPYVQSMAKTLELDPAKVDVFDPTIRKALQTVDPKTGKPGAQPLWQFEQGLRQDPRWKQTQQAQDSLMNVGHDLLRSFGMVS